MTKTKFQFNCAEFSLISNKLTMSDCCISQWIVLPVLWTLVSWSVDLLIKWPGKVLIFRGKSIIILCSPLLWLYKVSGGVGFKPRSPSQWVCSVARCSAVVPLFRWGEASTQEWVHSFFPQHYIALAVSAGLSACATVIFMFLALTVLNFQFTVLTGNQPLSTLQALIKTINEHYLIP